MKHQKHTPGPWTVYRQDSRYIIREALGFDLSSDVALDELDANAALIAAAPEMLEALEQALRLIATAENNGAFKDCALPLVGQRLIGKIESVIKKVKGE